MNRYERMLVKAERHGVESYEMPFYKDCGYYTDNTIFINRTSTNATKHGLMGEELGHHFTSDGNILDFDDPNSTKQEAKARRWGFDHTVPLTRLIEAIDYPCINRAELADYLEVTEEHLLKALDYYKQKYGLYVTIGKYTIMFEPLSIIKMFE